MMKSSSLLHCCLLAFCCLGKLGAATSLGVREPEPPGMPAGEVPVALATSEAAVAMQADVLFDPAGYTVTDASDGTQPQGVLVQSRLVEPGRLRVVVYHRSGGALGSDVIFRVPLTAVSGVVGDDPVVLTNFMVAGQGGDVLASGLLPKVRLLGLRDGQSLNGRLGIELSVAAQAAAGSITKLEYYVGGLLLGEGTGANFAYLWTPPTSGPFEITAVAYDSNGLMASTRTVPVVVTHVGTYTGPVVGSYFGLVRGRVFDFRNDGYVAMTSTTARNFTLKLLTGGKTWSASGKFDVNGNATVTIKRTAPLAPLTVVLAQSSAPQVDQIHGRVADGTFTNGKFTGHTFQTEFTVDRLVWSAAKRPQTLAGAYTVLIPAAADAAVTGAPLGTGYGAVAVGKDGSAKLTGSLADGTAVTASSWLSKDGRWPVYASLNAAKGVLMGEMEFAAVVDVSDFDGTLRWMRPADAKAAAFKAGFSTLSDAVGARYVKPPANQTLIPLANVGGNASLYLTDGGLPAGLERLVAVSGANKALVPLQDADQTTLTLTAATGLMGGGFLHPDTQKMVSFKGAVLQSQQLLAGYFVAGPLGGDVRAAANPDFPPGIDDAGPIGLSPLPVVKITAPAANTTLKTISGNAVRVKGTASDKQGIASVLCQVLHDGVLTSMQAAAGTTAWTYDIPIAAGEGGLYTVFAKAVDLAGHESEVASLRFWTPLKSSLTVTVNGPGKVTKGFLGSSEREVGKLVTITATANTGKRFLGWTGSVTSSSPKITVLMKAGTALQANFGDKL